MNKANTLPTEMAADRFARRVTARLTSGTDDLPYDISERLRAARMQAHSRTASCKESVAKQVEYATAFFGWRWRLRCHGR